MPTKVLRNIINAVLSLYILSLFIFTYHAKLYVVSNVIVGILMVLIVTYLIMTKTSLKIPNTLLLAGGFLVYVFLNIFISVDRNETLTRFMTLAQLIPVMFLIKKYLNESKSTYTAIRAFSLSGLIASIVILVISDFKSGKRFGWQLGNVNSIGMLLSISALMTIFIVLNHNKKYAPILLLVVPFVFLTGSRKALLFLFVGIFVLVIMYEWFRGKNIIKYLIGTLILIIVSYWLIMNNTYLYNIIGHRIEKFTNFLTGNGEYDNSIVERFNMIKEGFSLIKQKPITGYGYGTYKFMSVYETYSHNNFIEIAYGGGLIGFILFYSMYIYVMVIRFKKRSEHHLFAALMLAILITYFFTGMTLVYYYAKEFWLLLFIATINPLALPTREIKDKETLLNNLEQED